MPVMDEQLHRDAGEGDAHDRGGHDAPEDRLLALIGRQARGCHADDDRIIAREDNIDHQNLHEWYEPFWHGGVPLNETYVLIIP
jgi:hypothetical protein